MPSLLRRTSPAARQRGAISIMAGVGIAVMISAALMMVDLGSLVYTKRHLQSVADNAALSAVNNPADAQNIAVDTAARNDFPLGGAHSNTVVAVSGHYDATKPTAPFQGTFDTTGPPEDDNAVQVTVTTQQPYFFLVGSREVAATATAVRDNYASFSLGSGLLSLNSSQSPLLNALLGTLLHSTINLDAMSYNGLANARVSLLDLVKADADVGTLQELLDANVSVGRLIGLTATALTHSDIADLDLVLASLDLLKANVPGDLNLRLGDLLKVSLADGTSAADAKVNVLQLITAAAQVANGEHFLDVPIIGVNLPGIVGLNLNLSLIEPPTIAVGPPGKDSSGNWLTTAHTAQTRLKLILDVLPLLGGVVHLPLYLELAQGNAWLEDIQCRVPREDSIVTIGANVGAAGIYIGEINPDAMTNRATAPVVTPAQILNVLELITVTAKTAISTTSPGASNSQVEIKGPFPTPPPLPRVGGGLSVGGLLGSLADTTDLEVGGPLGSLLNFVIELITLGTMSLEDVLKLILTAIAPLGDLVDAIVQPVLSLLGIQIGYADISVMDVVCGTPRLVR